MLPKGTIARVIDWFMTNPSFEHVRDEAFARYFIDEHGHHLKKTDEDYTLCVEWLIFDYKLDCGHSVLEEYVDVHDVLTDEEAGRYKQIIATNFYGLFSVLEVQLGTGFTCRDLVTERLHDVSDRSSSRVVLRGDCIMTRLAYVDGTTQIVSANVKKVESQEAEALLRFLRLTDQDVNLLNLRRNYTEFHTEPPRWDALLHRADVLPTLHTLKQMEVLAKERFFLALKRMHLDRLVKPSEIYGYLHAPGADQNMMVLLNEMFLRKHSKEKIYRMNDVIRSWQTCVNYAVRNGDKSSFNLLLVGAMEARYEERRRTKMDFERLLILRQEADDVLSGFLPANLSKLPSEAFAITAYILDWFFMEDPWLFQSMSGKQLAGAGMYATSIFHAVTHDLNEPSFDDKRLLSLSGYRKFADLLDAGDELMIVVCGGLRDASIFAVDPDTAPDFWDERLHAFVDSVNQMDGLS